MSFRQRSGQPVASRSEISRSTQRAIATLALVGSALAFSPAAAQPAAPTGPQAEIVAAVVDGAKDTVTLIGPSGQIYAINQPGTWQRGNHGGIASDVAGAIRVPGGAIVAVPRRTPVFRLEGGSWHVAPLPNRGRTTAAGPGSGPALAIGRHVYVPGTSGWRRLVSARARVTALWADPGASEPRVTIATESGKLFRASERSRRVIRNPLAAGDPVVALMGRAGTPVYAVAKSGRVLRLGRGAARALALAPEAQGFAPHAGGVDPSGVLWLAGDLPVAAPAPAGDEATGQTEAPGAVLDPPTEPVVVRADRRTLTVADKLSNLEQSDRVVVVHAASDGQLILATKNGEIRLRSQGGTWHNGSLISELPARSPRPRSPGPATAR